MITTRVKCDDITSEVSKVFDYKFDGTSAFEPWPLIESGDFQIGVIVGPSGSGKSVLLSQMGKLFEDFQWDKDRAIISHFESSAEAIEKLGAVGLNSVPQWFKPFHCLSNGEQFRASVAMGLKDGAAFDEFTSVVDRNVAKSTSRAFSRFVKKSGYKGIILASCHYDILEWLEPDWVFDTGDGIFTRRLERRPQIEVKAYECNKSAWEVFRKHHYLDTGLNKSARCYIGTWEGVPVAFTAVLALPSGTVKNAYREHRTVVLPDFQGLGIGTKWSDLIARVYLSEGKNYYSKTSHPRMGGYRESSPIWAATAHNKKANNLGSSAGKAFGDEKRICFSHKFIGP